MINTGAIALCTLIEGKSYKEKFLYLLDLTRKMAESKDECTEVYLRSVERKAITVKDVLITQIYKTNTRESLSFAVMLAFHFEPRTP